jgi:hypothetical protein
MFILLQVAKLTVLSIHKIWRFNTACTVKALRYIPWHPSTLLVHQRNPLTSCQPIFLKSGFNTVHYHSHCFKLFFVDQWHEHILTAALIPASL